MPDVHVNPDELRQFAAHLKKLATELTALRNLTKAKANHLSQSWRDNENKQFAMQFDRDIKPIERLIKTAEEYSQFLKRKATAVDVYINTKK